MDKVMPEIGAVCYKTVLQILQSPTAYQPGRGLSEAIQYLSSADSSNLLALDAKIWNLRVILF
jgi:hypothetical protein